MYLQVSFLFDVFSSLYFKFLFYMLMLWESGQFIKFDLFSFFSVAIALLIQNSSLNIEKV